MWFAVVRPRQGCPGLGRERPRSLLHFRCRRGQQVPQPTRPGPDLQSAPGTTEAPSHPPPTEQTVKRSNSILKILHEMQHWCKCWASGLHSLTSQCVWRPQVVEDGYEFFAKRQLVTLFSAPNYCGEFDNAGGMMSVDETLMCSFQVWHRD